MVDIAWSQDAPADIVGEVETATVSIVAVGMVTDGAAVQGSVPPFVTCWQLEPDMWGSALASESFGVFQQRWQVSAHGATQGQARILAEQISGHDWPVGWELVEIGPMVPDDTDIPATWFYPLTFVFRGLDT